MKAKIGEGDNRRMLSKWIAKHRPLAKWLFIIFPITFFILLDACGAPPWFNGLFTFCVCLVSFLAPEVACAWVLNKPGKEYQQTGNIEVYMNAIEEVLTYPNSKVNQQAFLISYGGMLVEVGETERGLEILKGIYIDQYNSTHSANKYCYYANLSWAYEALGNDGQAEIWYRKSMEIYCHLPQNKYKMALTPSALLSSARRCYHRGEYGEAQQLLDKITDAPMPTRIHMAFLRGSLALEAGDTEGAKANLQYVLTWGSKLYIAKIAQEKLRDLA